jgi:predicted RNase H-like nuclease
LRVAHSFAAFVHSATKRDASFADVLQSARALLDDGAPDVIAVDMPMSHNTITRRRASDRAVSKLLTRYGCPAMPPQPASEKLSREYQAQAARVGASLRISYDAARTSGSLIEVYPHAVWMSLLGACYRVPYKVRKEYPHLSNLDAGEKKQRRMRMLQVVRDAIAQRIQDVPVIDASRPLKQTEDELDALACAWTGILYLNGQAKAYGDAESAIWVPADAESRSADRHYWSARLP